MKEHQKRYAIRSLAKVLMVSPAGYYRYKKRYGAPRITIELKHMGIRCSRNYIASILYSNGLRARNGWRFRYTSSTKHIST